MCFSFEKRLIFKKSHFRDVSSVKMVSGLISIGVQCNVREMFLNSKKTNTRIKEPFTVTVVADAVISKECILSYIQKKNFLI